MAKGLYTKDRRAKRDLRITMEATRLKQILDDQYDQRSEQTED